jgi:hypothetical protein
VGAVIAGAQIEIKIYGHADFDAKGRDFENEVSLERAQAAKTSLEGLVKEEATKSLLPEVRLQSITYSVMGLGTLRPVFTNPNSEEQRKANRRVEFLWATTIAPVAQESVFQRCVKVLTATTPPGPARRMTCACTKFLQPSPRVQDSVFNFHTDIPGRAGLPNLTPEQWEAAMKLLVGHLRQDIATASADPSDVQLVKSLIAIDDNVGRNINDFAMQMVGDSATGLFNRVIVGEIRWLMTQRDHVYSCYAGYSRRDADK